MFWQTLAVVRVEHADLAEFEAMLAEVLGRLETIGQTNRVRWERLLQIVLHWALFRWPRAEHAQILAAVQAAQCGALLKAEVTTVATQLKKNSEQELMERYHALGREESTTAAEERGAVATLRTTWIDQLREKFTDIPEAVSQRTAAAEKETLQKALRQVIRLDKLAEPQL